MASASAIAIELHVSTLSHTRHVAPLQRSAAYRQEISSFYPFSNSTKHGTPVAQHLSAPGAHLLIRHNTNISQISSRRTSCNRHLPRCIRAHAAEQGPSTPQSTNHGSFSADKGPLTDEGSLSALIGERGERGERMGEKGEGIRDVSARGFKSPRGGYFSSDNERPRSESMDYVLSRRFKPLWDLRTFSSRVLAALWVRSVAATVQVMRTLSQPGQVLAHHTQGAQGIRTMLQKLLDSCATGDAVWPKLLLLALPACAAGMAEPMALMSETRLLAKSGAVQLAAVGVSVSVFNLVSKVLNFPLLNITTSFVAAENEAQAALLQGSEEAQGETLTRRKASPAVSAALVVGVGLGVFEALLLAFFAAQVVQFMGVAQGSSMLQPAAQYLQLRAIGAPAVVVSLAAQGVFRGYKDTSTPLYATVSSNIVDIILHPLLMFSCHLGLQGAALATVAAQYCMAGYLLWRLSCNMDLMPPKLSDLKFDKFLQSGGLLFGRTLALLATMTLATSMAARQGAVPMAAHQICSQTWLAASLLADSVALAAQTLLASAFARNDSVQVQRIATRSLQLGAGMGLVLAGALALGMPFLPRVFTSDPGVLAEMSRILPAVVLLQPITAIAFVFDGLHYGASDFKYAALAMIALVIPAIPVLLWAPSQFGLAGVWMGLALITTSRVGVGFFRLGTKSGPWAVLDSTPSSLALATSAESAPLASTKGQNIPSLVPLEMEEEEEREEERRQEQKKVGA